MSNAKASWSAAVLCRFLFAHGHTNAPRSRIAGLKFRWVQRILLILSAQFLSIAQEPAAGVVTLTPQLVNELAEEARTNNAALWASRARIVAAKENAKSIPLWRDPEVMVGGMVADQEMRAEDGDLIYGVEQMLPVFGKEKAMRNAARSEIQVEEADFDFQFQTLRKS